MRNTDFSIIGAGLAGCECALILARAGHSVTLFEQKPLVFSEAHRSGNLSELVCSNSLRSNELTSGIGLLKEELRLLGSPFMQAADQCAVPAGKALAVDRELLAREITSQVAGQPAIRLIRRQITALTDPEFVQNGRMGRIVAAGPLLDGSLANAIAEVTGSGNCYFYDAIAPVVWTDTLNRDVVFRASRYDDNEAGDYLNCPMSREEYLTFYNALIEGEIWRPHGQEEARHFEGCMPIEALAARGEKTLAFGPLKPVGLVDPRTGARPWAVLQLRPENRNLETCNLVGCQTKLLQSEQRRIFRLVPGLEQAEFARYGSMHRNTYVDAPRVLTEELSLRGLPGVYLAGQITGVEGYVESVACGHWLALALAAHVAGRPAVPPPQESAMGSLLRHLRTPAKHFQPSNANFGLMPELEERARKKERREKYSHRARRAFASWLTNLA